MTSRTLARTVTAVVPLVVLALGVSACGADQKKDPKTVDPTPSATASTPSVDLPAGTTLTKAGSRLTFGDPATVAFAPTPDKSTGLQLTVLKVAKGRIGDLAAYQLDKQTRTSTPYYATVRVKNVGHGDVGKSAIPLWGLSSDDTLIGASGFTNSFKRCASGPLPTSFAAGASTATCLMFLVPKGGSLEGVSYRPLMDAAPIVWKGTITTAVTKKKTAKKK